MRILTTAGNKEAVESTGKQDGYTLIPVVTASACEALKQNRNSFSHFVASGWTSRAVLRPQLCFTARPSFTGQQWRRLHFPRAHATTKLGVGESSPLLNPYPWPATSSKGKRPLYWTNKPYCLVWAVGSCGYPAKVCRFLRAFLAAPCVQWAAAAAL